MDKITKIINEIGIMEKTEENPFYKSKYFDINSLLAQLKPLLLKYDLTVTQPLTNELGRPAIRTSVFEGDKIVLTDTITLPDLQDPMKMGACITYYRRYALVSMFMLQAEDLDGAYKGEKKLTTKEYQAKNKADFDNGEDIGF